MKKQKRLLWLVSIFFLASGLLNSYGLFWLKTTSVLPILSIILYSLFMFIVAFGLLKLMPWARYAALIIVVINVIPFLKGSVHNIIVMSDHAIGLSAKIFTILVALAIVVIFFSIQVAIIWWLFKSSTKALFDAKKRGEKEGDLGKKIKGSALEP